MQSDVDVLKACVHKAIQELINLKKAKAELESNLRALNAKRVDVETKRSAELRRGKEIREEVKNWFNDVEQMKDEVQNNEGLIKLLCSPENIARIVLATSSETSFSNVSYAGNSAVNGVGGIGISKFKFDGSTITTNIGNVKTTNHHYYHDKGTK